MKKLKEPQLGLERFFSHVDLLGAKLGHILLQLSPRIEVDPKRLQGFLQAPPPGNRYAFEFRYPSWNATPIFDLLARFRAAYCIFDLAGFQSPLQLTMDFTESRRGYWLMSDIRTCRHP
jgi:uncharacterized protein YecE (DUF72 family)